MHSYGIVFKTILNKQSSPKGVSYANIVGSSPKMLIVASGIYKHNDSVIRAYL